MNYLPDAWNHGAEIYTQVSVRYLERDGDLWRVHYEVLGAGRERFDSPTMFMTAEVVILAAGTLGSTEILLRSREEGLRLSPRLGHGFTGNGDVLGFGYNCDQPINGIGVGPDLDEVEEPVGPCITGIIDLRKREELDEGMVIEEGVIPSPLARMLPPVFAAASGLLGDDTDSGAPDMTRERGRELHSLVRGPYHGAVHNTQTFLVMTHDDCTGRMYLEDDRLRIEWPGVGSQPSFTRVSERLQEATKALGGTYLINPIWADWAKHDLVTVHPLGGCSMAESAAEGVVNHKGQVFSGETGDEAYGGLYVCDGAVVPRSLGVNPLLTICALAERTCALLARDRGWALDYALPSAPRQMYTKAPLGIQFTESMKGFFSTAVTGDYQEGWEQGKRDGSRFEFTLTIISDDLERTLNGDDHSASIVGTVVAPALSAQPMTVTGGEFNLFVKDLTDAGTRKMRYRMTMTSEEGNTYYFDGFKVARDDPGLDTWSDTTTLYITVHEGDGEAGPVLGKGILKIRPTDFMRQMTTMKVNNAENLAQALEANARFGSFFAGTLFSTYARFARGNRKAGIK
jgi:cholesterol oxidase